MSAAGLPPFPPFAVTVVHHESEVAVVPSGELDLGSAGALTDAVHELWSAGSDRILVDLRPLEFIDSCGLRALLGLREAAARDGRDFALRPGPSVVQRIFDLTGTRALFHWRSVAPPVLFCDAPARSSGPGARVRARRRPAPGVAKRSGASAPRRRPRDPE